MAFAQIKMQTRKVQYYLFNIPTFAKKQRLPVSNQIISQVIRQISGTKKLSTFLSFH